MVATTRRGFIQAAVIGIAAAGIGLRLSHGPMYLSEELKYTWDQPNPDYSYGINKKQPWDVLIFDEKAGEYITPKELHERGKLQWFGQTPAPMWHDGDLLAPVKPEGQPEEILESLNNFDDQIDRAFGAYAAVVISQGFIGWEDEGKPGFDAPMKEIEEDVDARIYTTSREYYAN